jgi:hypothetical protein
MVETVPLETNEQFDSFQNETSLASNALFTRVGETKETTMPAFLVPVLWVGGAAFLLGGGYYVIAHLAH